MNLDDADRILKKSKKAEKPVVFSLDDVRKSIYIYAEDIKSKTSDISNDFDDTAQDINECSENCVEDSYQASNNSDNKKKEVDQTQNLINIYFAISKAKIKPYKDQQFVVQLFVETQQEKNAIDSVRKDLTQFIVKRYHYPYFKIDIVVSDEFADKSVAYTPVEKFRELKKVAPAIEILKNVFDCEIKY